MSDKKVQIEIEAVTKGSAAIEKLQDELRGIGKAGVEAAPQAEKLTKDLDQLGQAGATAAPKAKSVANEMQEAGQASADAAPKMKQAATALDQAGNASATAAPQARQLASALQGVINEQKATAESSRGLASGMAKVEEHVVAARNAMLALVGIAGFSDLVGNAVKTADAWDNMNARLKIVTSSTEAYSIAQADVLRISRETSSDLESTFGLYTKLSGALKETSLSQKEIAGLTEITNKALQAGGASGTEAAAAIQQFSQAMGSGVLRGDEFNSMAEASPALMDALARGLGKPRTELKALADEGALTTERVATALLSQKESIDKAYAELPQTVGRSITNLSTSWSIFVGQLNESTATTSVIAGAIDGVSNNLETLMRIGTELGTGVAFVWALKAIDALKVYRAEVIASGAATGILAAELRALPTNLVIGVAFVGYEIGHQIGTMLYENSETARQFGVAMVATGVVAVGALKTIYEASKALFTGDTVTAAINRNAKEMQQKLDILREQFAEAGISSEEMGEKADAAGKKTVAATKAGSASVVDLSKSFDLAKVSADKLKETMGQAFTAGGVDALGKALISLPPKMAVTQTAAEGIAEALKKVDAEDLLNLQAQLQFAAKAGKNLGVQIDAVRTESFRRLGLDADQVLIGISKKSTDVIASFKALAYAGGVTGDALATAMKAAFKSVDSEKAVLSLKAEMIDLGKKGKLTGEQIAAGMQVAERALNKTHQAITPLEEALDRLGLKTKKALQFEADQAVKDLALVRTAVQRGELAANALDTALERVEASAKIAGLTSRQEAAKTELQTRKGTEALNEQASAGMKAGEGIAAGQRIAQGEITKTLEEITKLKNAAADASESVRRNTLTPVRVVGAGNLNDKTSDELSRIAGGSDGTNGDTTQQMAYKILQQRKADGQPDSSVFQYRPKRNGNGASQPDLPTVSASPTPAPYIPAPTSAPQEVLHRIEISTPNGRGISLTANSRTDVDELLNVLADYKSRSAL